MLPTIQPFLSIFFPAYRKHCSANHALMSLIEILKKNLENNKIVGVVFLDLSKAFDCMPHDLLVTKMEAYGFSEDCLTFSYLYLKSQN